MTTILEALQALAARPEPIVEPLAFIAHPAWTEDEGTLTILRGMQANGVAVLVMPDIRLPSVSLDCWLDRKPVEVCGNCDTALPGGCGGLFSNEEQCRWRPRCVVCNTEQGLRLGRGDQKWRCQNAECT